MKILLVSLDYPLNKPLFSTPELTLQERRKAFRYAKKAIQKHTKERKLKFEGWLSKKKLHDYYHIDGLLADVITWLYHQKWSGKLIKFFAFLLEEKKKL